MAESTRKGRANGSTTIENIFAQPVDVGSARRAATTGAPAFGMATVPTVADWLTMSTKGQASDSGALDALDAVALPDVAAAAFERTGYGQGGNPAKGGNPESNAGGNPLGNGGDGVPNNGVSNGVGGGNAFGPDGNPERGPNREDGENPGNRPDNAGNPGIGNGDGGGDGIPDRPDDAGNPGNGNGDGTGDGDGISDRPPPAPTPPDVPLLDPDTVQYKAGYTFSVNDVTVGWDGETIGTRGTSLDETTTRVTKEGVTLNPIDSEFGFYVHDFIGALGKEFDGDFGEGWVGALPDGNGIAVADARTDLFSVPAQLGTWLKGIGGNTVKASTEHYSTMQAILSDQKFPGDTSGFYKLDDDLRMIDYLVGEEGTPEEGMPVDSEGQLSSELKAGPMHDFYIKELAQALDEAGKSEQAAIDFDRDGKADDYNAFFVEKDFDGFTRTVAAVDLDADGKEEYYDSNLNGFGVFGIQDILKPNESSIIEDIAYGDDYSVTLKDDGKLLYRWGNAVKRPNDIRIDAKIPLPDEWKADEDGDGYADNLFRITAAELVVNHTVTNNPNDQIRPEDFENEAAIGILPSYVVIKDPLKEGNVLWVSEKSVYSGDGTLLPSYFSDEDTGVYATVLGPDGSGVDVRAVNVDAAGNPIGTILRDFSLIEEVMGDGGDQAPSLLAEIGATSADLEQGFTEAYWTTMDREPFVADYTEDGTDYEIGPRWRLQPDKYGQDLPGVTIPQDITDPMPVQNGEEKYEVGADTTTVLNLLDWHGPSPLSLSAGWMTDAGGVSVNGLNMTTDFDVAFYVKGDMKPVNLYGAELLMEYEAVPIAGRGTANESVEVWGSPDKADTLIGRGFNTFHFSGGYDDRDFEADLAVIGYGATTPEGLGFNEIYDFSVEDGDAIGLIGFGLDPDNYNIHIDQSLVTDAADQSTMLTLSLDGHYFAALHDVSETLEIESFYFA